MRPENARPKSKIISVSLPRELVYRLNDLAVARNLKLSRLVAMIIVEELGFDPNILRGPGNPRRREPDLYDQIKAQMGEMAPSRKDIKELFPGAGPLAQE